VARGKIVRRLAGQSFLYGLGSIGNRVLGFVTTPIITRCLTLQDYGVLGLMRSVGSIMGIIFPFNAGVLFPNDYVRAKSADERRLVLSTMYFFQLLSIIFFGVIALQLSESIASYVLKEPQYSIYVKITTIGTMLASARGVAVGYLQMTQRVGTYSLITFLSGAAGSLLTIFALLIWHVNLVQLMWLGVATQIFSSGCYFWVMRKDLILKLSLRHIREIFRLGIPTFGHAFAQWVLGSLDMILLQRLSTKTDVGLYSFAYRFAFLMNIFVYGFSASWQPHMANSLAAQSDMKDFDRLIAKPCKVAILLLSSLGLGLAFFGPEVTLILAPKRYLDALPAIPLIMLAQLFSALYFTVSTIPHYMKKNKYLPLTTGSAALTNALLNWWLIPRHGMMGAAVSATVSFAVLYGTTLILANLSLRVPLPHIRNLLTISAHAAVYILFVYFIAVQPLSLFSMLCRAIAVVIAFGISLLIMFPRSECIELAGSTFSYVMKMAGRLPRAQRT
jgi:O-antigen/teichoic acid export membrane protein